MGFLGGLFKKKAGGTMVGNLLRGVANKATNGILGNGAGIINQEQEDILYLPDTDFIAKYGYTKAVIQKQMETGVAPPVLLPTANISPAKSNQVETEKVKLMDKIKDFFKTSEGKIVGYILVIGVVIFLWKKFGKRSKSSKGIFN